jgi:hypothetical protein
MRNGRIRFEDGRRRGRQAANIASGPILRQIDFYYEIFRSSATKNVLVYQNGFWCSKNDFGAVKTNLSLMPFGRR